MRVICPLSACSSYEKRDQFLALLSDIAVVTEESEPQTLAYCWFQSTGENADVPNYYVRGFEVYKDENALANVHRMSEPYKKMRALVVPDEILERPTDLRFLQPTGIGFMSRLQGINIRKDDNSDENVRKLVVFEEIKPKQGMKNCLLKDMRSLAIELEWRMPEVGSYWLLEYLEEYLDNGILIFSTYESYSAYETYLKWLEEKESSTSLNMKIELKRSSTWRDSGIGFCGR